MISKKNLIKLFDEKIKKKLEVAQSEADTITGLINPFIDLSSLTLDFVSLIKLTRLKAQII